VGLLFVMSAMALLALPGLTVRLGRRLPPSEWAAMARWALVVGAAAVELSFALYAAPTLFRAVGVPALATMCRRILAGFLPGGPTAGWTALAAAVTLPALGAVGAWRARQAYATVRADVWLGQHHEMDGVELVVLPTAQPLAVSVAGDSGQILVSRGLVDALTEEQLQLVVDHEMAHLRLGHQRVLQFATALDHAFAFFWPMRQSTAALRVALERCADEEAAGTEPLRRAQLRAALLSVGGLAAGNELAALSTPETVLERLAALDVPPRPPSALLRGALYLPGSALGALLIMSMGAWGGQARMVLAMAGRCPG